MIRACTLSLLIPYITLCSGLRSSASQSSAKISMDAMKLDSLLAAVARLPLPKQRAIASVTGSCVMDAAARPFHWCYDQAVIEEALKDGQDAAFYPTSMSPYYTIATGQNSCYYDMGYVMLHSLPSKVNEPLDTEAYKLNVDNFFGLGSEYNDAFIRRNYLYDPAKRYEKRDPVDGPWQQSSVTIYLEQRKNEQSNMKFSYGNAKSRETDGLVSTLPLIARLSIDENENLNFASTQSKVKLAASFMSTNPLALTHTLTAAVLLSNIINGRATYQSGEFDQLLHDVANVDNNVCFLEGGVKIAVNGIEVEEKFGHELVIDELNAVIEALRVDPAGKDHIQLVASWGKQCANPGSFQGALHAYLASTSFIYGTRMVICAGGCNCSRANFAGAFLGARYGFGGSLGIPTEWILKSSRGIQVLELALSKFN